MLVFYEADGDVPLQILMSVLLVHTTVMEMLPVTIPCAVTIAHARMDSVVMEEFALVIDSNKYFRIREGCGSLEVAQ